MGTGEKGGEFIGFKPPRDGGKKVAGVYKLTHRETGVFYLGGTTNGYKRMSYHLGALRKNEHYNLKLQQAFNASPVFDLDFCVVGIDDEVVCLEDEVKDREQELLDKYKNHLLCCNVSWDARSPTKGAEFSDETRKKLSDSWTRERRLKASALVWGKPLSEEHRSKISEALIGHSVSDQARQKQSEARKKMFKDEAAREKARLSKRAYMKPVMINGVRYDGVKAAARALGIKGPHNVTNKCLNAKYPDWVFIQE